MNKEELQDILNLHKEWVTDKTRGKRANLEDANLWDANLRDANLRGANLRGANLWRADLEDANLWDANLRDTNLRDANLRGANLRDTNLRDANLRGANLRGANLEDANLWDANLRDTNLRDANLRDANLRGAKNIPASMQEIYKKDMFDVLLRAIPEIPNLKAAILAGKIDGSTYEGECACLCGTLEKTERVKVKDLVYDLRDSSRPIEMFFAGINKGDTPETSEFSKLALEWVEEFESFLPDTILEGKGE